MLRSLAGLSAKVVAPFGGKTGTGTTGKGRSKGGKAGATGVKPLAVDIVGNVTSILPPKTELVVPVVGEMIKIQNKATEAIPVNVKITRSFFIVFPPGSKTCLKIKACTDYHSHFRLLIKIRYFTVSISFQPKL